MKKIVTTSLFLHGTEKESDLSGHLKPQSTTKWVETLLSIPGFLLFTDFKSGKYSFSSPIPFMQCCAAVRATYIKQTPQHRMEGTGEGCGFFCSLKLPYLSTMSP